MEVTGELTRGAGVDMFEYAAKVMLSRGNAVFNRRCSVEVVIYGIFEVSQQLNGY